jgi:GxxExxY protein
MLDRHTDLSPEQEAIVSEAIGCGIAVHRELGPGFTECIYHRAFRLELESRGMPYESEKPIQVKYREWRIPGQKIDLIVADTVSWN